MEEVKGRVRRDNRGKLFLSVCNILVVAILFCFLTLCKFDLEHTVGAI